MEIEEAREVRTTCPYCGVGCGVLAKVRPGRGRLRPPAPPPTATIGRRGGNLGWGGGPQAP
ncbi:hypothetical protein NKJ06_18855 [Mesorhizobium sp. M0293]|uniref:hypothetical protein n=1 Tax=Mesorhizobium sp. M0293 TaxID=2956930 RepID=UPI00333AFA3E